MGRSGPRGSKTLRISHPRRCAGRPELGHDSPQARALSRSLRSIRSRTRRPLRQAKSEVTFERPRNHPQPFEDRSRHLQRESVFERSEEHTSELQSLAYLVCRLLLEKKNRSPSAHTWG